MKLSLAQNYAAQIVQWLAPLCDRIEIAGSIRREQPHCNDVDLVCIPKLAVDTDMFGNVVGSRNLLWEFLYNHVADGKAKFQSGGNQPGKFVILQLKKCQLDVYFATPETWATRFLCRTGSKEHNIFLAQRAQDEGGKWEPYDGLILGGASVPASLEADIYTALRLPYIEPKNRETHWLNENTGACL